jgi:hypothetical protein
VREWYRKHPGEILNEMSFATHLKQVNESSAKQETLVNGFEAYGFYPFNPKTLDYIKCL